MPPGGVGGHTGAAKEVPCCQGGLIGAREAQQSPPFSFRSVPSLVVASQVGGSFCSLRPRSPSAWRSHYLFADDTDFYT